MNNKCGDYCPIANETSFIAISSLESSDQANKCYGSKISTGFEVLLEFFLIPLFENRTTENENTFLASNLVRSLGDEFSGTFYNKVYKNSGQFEVLDEPAFAEKFCGTDSEILPCVSKEMSKYTHQECYSSAEK